MANTFCMANRDTIPGMAARLRAARKKAGLTQTEAARRSGVHYVSISRFETGVKMPTLKALMKLAAAYGVSVCDLIPGGTNAPRTRGKPARGDR